MFLPEKKADPVTSFIVIVGSALVLWGGFFALVLH